MIYADLLGNKKKPGIKSPGDNKVKVAQEMTKSTRLAGNAMEEALRPLREMEEAFRPLRAIEEALRPAQSMRKASLLGGAALAKMSFDAESLGLGRLSNSTYSKYISISFILS